MAIQAMLVAPAALILAASAAHGCNTPDRAALAVSLREAQDLRASFRAKIERAYLEGERPRAEERVYVTLLLDGRGRQRREAYFPQEYRGRANVVQVDVWDGRLLMQQCYQAAKKNTARNSVIITETLIQSNDHEKVKTAFGQRFFHSEESPADILARRDGEVTIRESSLMGTPVIEVEFSRLPFSRAARIIHRYDPARQWLLLEQETLAYGGMETSSTADDVLLFHERLVAGELNPAGGVWVPGRIDVYATIRPGQKDEQKYHAITHLSNIEIAPAFSDGDFTVDLASLPLHSEIADARIGATYRIGENIVYLDGRLHEVKEVITGPIEPEAFPIVMAGATAIVDPRQLASGRMTIADWMRLAGYGLLAAAVFGTAVVFFRHKWSGA